MLTIQEKIRKTINNFYNKNWPSKEFLTEDDVRCRLFQCLSNALDGVANISIHSEVRWYGNDPFWKLKYRSDLVIIDNNNLSVDGNIFELPSKGYGFDNYYAIIEIKFRRINDRQSDRNFVESIKADMNKLKEIKLKTNSSEKDFYVLVFDRKRNKRFLTENLDDSAVVFKDWNLI